MGRWRLSPLEVFRVFIDHKEKVLWDRPGPQKPHPLGGRHTRPAKRLRVEISHGDFHWMKNVSLVHSDEWRPRGGVGGTQGRLSPSAAARAPSGLGQGPRCLLCGCPHTTILPPPHPPAGCLAALRGAGFAPRGQREAHFGSAQTPQVRSPPPVSFLLFISPL